jgi:hypothetical protein
LSSSGRLSLDHETPACHATHLIRTALLFLRLETPPLAEPPFPFGLLCRF